MSTTFNVAKSLEDMLQNKLASLETTMRIAIKYQLTYYESCKQKTLDKVLGNSESNYDLVQHFKYQATVKTVLTEMERTYLEYFGKPWDYVEPELEEVEPVPTKKRGRPAKNAI
jgi:hypothetical protein